MALLNELLQEAAERSVVLAQEASDADEAIENVMERVHALATRVTTEGDKAQRELREALTQVAEWEKELDTAASEASGSLDKVEVRAGEVRTQVGELLVAIRRGLTDLEGHREQIQGTLDSDMQAAEQDFAQLSQEIADLGETTGHQLEETSNAIIAFEQTVNSISSELEQHKAGLLGAIDAVGEAAQHQTDAWIGGLDSMLAEETNDLIEMANNMLTAHNDAMEALGHKLAEEVKAEAESAVGPLNQMIEALAGLCGSCKGTFSGKAQEIQGKVREANALLDRIEPVLQMASRLD